MPLIIWPVSCKLDFYMKAFTEAQLAYFYGFPIVGGRCVGVRSVGLGRRIRRVVIAQEVGGVGLCGLPCRGGRQLDLHPCADQWAGNHGRRLADYHHACLGGGDLPSRLRSSHEETRHPELNSTRAGSRGIDTPCRA